MRAPTLIAIVSAALPLAHGHGMLVDPPSRNFVASLPGKCQGGRGCLAGKNTVFVACHEQRNPGCKEYNPFGLTSGSFSGRWNGRWGGSMCGDPVEGSGSGRDPVPWWKGGEPYMQPTPPQVTYKPGQIVEFKVKVKPEHGGFYTFRICEKGLDGERFGGVASREAGEACLNKWILQRAPVETRPITELPIDEKNPDRWYVMHNNNETQGARFVIPKDLACKKCTLQWFWMTGNTCAFDDNHISYCSRHACKFGKKKLTETCTDMKRAPELTWNCADIAVGAPAPAPASRRRRRSQPTPNPVEERLERLEQDMKSMKTMIRQMSKLLAGGSKPSRRRSS